MNDIKIYTNFKQTIIKSLNSELADIITKTLVINTVWNTPNHRVKVTNTTSSVVAMM